MAEPIELKLILLVFGMVLSGDMEEMSEIMNVHSSLLRRSTLNRNKKFHSYYLLLNCFQYLSFGDEIHAFVTASPDIKAYVVKDENGEDITLTPRWYCSRVWRGPAPATLQQKQSMDGVQNSGAAHKYDGKQIQIDDVQGRIIVNQLRTGTGNLFYPLIDNHILKKEKYNDVSTNYNESLL